MATVTLITVKRYLAALDMIREREDMRYVLRKPGAYNHGTNKMLPVFSYQEASSPDLISFKNKFNKKKTGALIAE